MSLRKAKVYACFRAWWYLGLMGTPSDWLAVAKFVAKRRWTYKTYQRAKARKALATALPRV